MKFSTTKKLVALTFIIIESHALIVLLVLKLSKNWHVPYTWLCWRLHCDHFYQLPSMKEFETVFVSPN